MSHVSLPKLLTVTHHKTYPQLTKQSALAEVLQSDQVKRLLNRPNIIIESIPSGACTKNENLRSLRNTKADEAVGCKVDLHVKNDNQIRNETPVEKNGSTGCLDKNETSWKDETNSKHDFSMKNESRMKTVTPEVSISAVKPDEEMRILPSKSDGQSEIALVVVKPEQKDCGHEEACENIVCDVAVQRYVDNSGVLPMLAVCIEDDEINAPVSKHCQDDMCDALSIDHNRCRRALIKLYHCDKKNGSCDICGVRLKTRRARLSHKICTRKDIYRHNETDGAQVLKEKMRERELEMIQAARMKKQQSSDPLLDFKKTMDTLRKNKELIIIPKTLPAQAPMTIIPQNALQVPLQQSSSINPLHANGRPTIGKVLPNVPIVYPQQGITHEKRTSTEAPDSLPMKQQKISEVYCSKVSGSTPNSSVSNAVSPQYIKVSAISQPNFVQPITLNDWFASQARIVGRDPNEMMKPYLTPIRVVPITKLQSPPSLFHRTHGIPTYCLVPDTSAKPIAVTNLNTPNTNSLNFGTIDPQTVQQASLATPNLISTLESTGEIKVTPNVPNIKPKGGKKTQHQRRRSEERSGKLFKCPYCLKGFSTDWYFKMHVAGHKGEILFSCKTCDKPFSNRYDMKKHILNDHDDGECRCETCGHISLCKSALEIHVRSHTGERPFRCNECHSSYRSSTDLKTHQRKRHDYIDCFYCFSQLRRTDLEDHLVTAHHLSKEEASNETTSHEDRNKTLDESSDNLEIVTDPSDSEFATNENSDYLMKQRSTSDEVVKTENTNVGEAVGVKRRRRRFNVGTNLPQTRTRKHLVPVKAEALETNKSNNNAIRCNTNNSMRSSMRLRKKRTTRKKQRRPKPRRKCRVCGILFRTATLLQEHLLNNPKPFVECPDCKRLFHTQTEYDEHNATYQSSCQDSQLSPPVKRLSRKRKRQPNLHKKIISKENVERGREHITAKGKIVPAKIFGEITACKCEHYCSTKINLARQKEIFSTYYDVSNKTQKTLLIRSSVKKRPVAPKKDKFLPIIPQKKREYNFHYYLDDSKGVEHEVCRKFFLECYQITPSAMNRAIQSAATNPSGAERRGEAPSANRTSEAAKNGVKNFINRFPKYVSHYGRSSTQKHYLNSHLNLATMYRMYKDESENENNKAVSENIFREIFHFEFNLSFKKRHTDTCRICDSIKINLDNKDLLDDEKKKLEESKAEHEAVRERIVEEFKRDVRNNLSEETAVLNYDLQRVLETPSLTTNIAFYKRQLATYNLCVYDELGKKAYMYVWSENVAGRGAQEIASCLRKHLLNHLPDSSKHLILYSDSCGGQNRKIKMTLMLKHYLASSKIDLIEQKFFLSGHSYNSCDRNFGLIEKERKMHEVVNTPDHWIEIIKGTKKKKPTFEVTKMESNDFFTSQELQKLIINRKVDEGEKKIDWLKTRTIKLDREQPFYLYMFYDNELLRRVDISKKNITEEQFKQMELSILYPNGNTITQAKYDDLMQLVNFIDLKYRPFYQQLRTNGAANDYDFASGDSDDE